MKEDKTISRAELRLMNSKERAKWIGVLPRYLGGSQFTPRSERKGKRTR